MISAQTPRVCREGKTASAFTRGIAALAVIPVGDATASNPRMRSCAPEILRLRAQPTPAGDDGSLLRRQSQVAALELIDRVQSELNTRARGRCGDAIQHQDYTSRPAETDASPWAPLKAGKYKSLEPGQRYRPARLEGEPDCDPMNVLALKVPGH